MRYARFGTPDVLRIVEAPAPIPAATEFAVRVAAAGLNPVDWKILRGDLRWMPMFARPPRGVGIDFAGTIAACGERASGFAAGDRVFGTLSPFGRQGTLAETIVAAADAMAPIPPSLDFAGAASLPVAAGTALQALVDHAAVQSGQRVLVTGAAGGVGGYAVQIARHLGAHVTGVCSAANAQYVRSLGADAVVDYRATDFAASAVRYDVVLDAAASRVFADVRRALAPSGVYITTLPRSRSIAAALQARLASRQRVVNLLLRAGAPLWRRLAALADAGALRPAIRRRIALEDAPAALAEIASGHGRGKIVVELPYRTEQGVRSGV
jgi:NADPH:quinone reductase-like Zn-dependent oxidoreductase